MLYEAGEKATGCPLDFFALRRPSLIRNLCKTRYAPNPVSNRKTSFPICRCVCGQGSPRGIDPNGFWKCIRKIMAKFFDLFVIFNCYNNDAFPITNLGSRKACTIILMIKFFREEVKNFLGFFVQ